MEKDTSEELVKHAKEYLEKGAPPGCSVVIATAVNAAKGSKRVLGSAVSANDSDDDDSSGSESEKPSRSTVHGVPIEVYVPPTETVKEVMNTLGVDARDVLDSDARQYLQRLSTSTSEHLVNVVAGTLRSVGNKNRLNYLTARFRTLIDSPLEMSTTRVFDSLLVSDTQTLPVRRVSRYSTLSEPNSQEKDEDEPEQVERNRADTRSTTRTSIGGHDAALAALFRELHGCGPEDAEPELRFSKTYWVEEYSRRLSSQRTALERMTEFCGLYSEFTESASHYARTIISERSVEYAERSIKPISLQGMGGENFLCAGIYMKFAIDLHGLYDGDDEMASKVARQDLRNLDRLHALVISNWNELGRLRLPMASVIDYKGLSVLATSYLPVENCTLVYGSRDGGSNIHNSCPATGAAMSKISKLLNLKDHTCGTTRLHLAGDIQVYKSNSGDTLYILDTSRLFPCEPPQVMAGGISSAGYGVACSLRPELVVSWGKPMCSDAHTAWDDSPLSERNAHNDVVRAAFLEVINQRIPEVAKFIDALGESTPADLTHILHARGVCIRHLKLLLNNIQSKFWRSIIMTEMAARSMKSLVKSLYAMETNSRNTIVPTEGPFVLLLRSFLSQIISKNPNSHVWIEFTEVFDAKFVIGGVVPAPDPEDVMWDVLLGRLFDLLGVQTYGPIVPISFGQFYEPAINMDPYFINPSILGHSVVSPGLKVHNFCSDNEVARALMDMPGTLSVAASSPAGATSLAGRLRRCRHWLPCTGMRLPLSLMREASRIAHLIDKDGPSSEKELSVCLNLVRESTEMAGEIVGGVEKLNSDPAGAQWRQARRDVVSHCLSLTLDPELNKRWASLLI